MSSPSVQNFTLYDVLVRNATAFGDRLALVTEDGEERSFADLRRRVDALAAGLDGCGLAAGDRLAVLAQNSAAYVELYFACARQGIVVYPVNWRLQKSEIELLIRERAKPSAFVVGPDFLDSVPGGPSAHARTDAQVDDGHSRSASAPVALGDRDSALRKPDAGRAGGGIAHWFQFGGDPASGYGAFDSLYADDDAAMDLPRPEVAADEPFAVIATAAVDVIPRGALLSHSNLVWANLQEIASLGLGGSDRNLVALPLFHIAALGHLLSVLHAGGANVITAKYDPVQAVELIDRHRITMISDFPPVLTTLLDAAAEAGSRLPSLRHVTGIDAPATMERLHQETDATFWAGFGQCETSGFVTIQNARERLGCAGKAAELCRVRLVDDDEREVPAGDEGEIVVRGPLVFLGYDGQPDVTAHTFRGGWHHTGDIGRFDDEGNLFYVARKPEKELIKPGGENVYPAEVEAAILELDPVRAVCVFGVADDRWGEAIRAVVEADPESGLDQETVREHVGASIARFKRPRDVIFTSKLPRSDGDRVDRAAVKERWGDA